MVVSGSISRAVSHELSLEIDDFGDDLGGGFKHVLFSALFGEDFLFD